ncbi:MULTISPECIES: hypothetical protein [Streptomyces]|uniref:hypothetical protein n=1 Tax=Streptomyces TaxID=1883 RepID=UPI002E2A8C0F|nr:MULTISPECIES: hypothetical protein [Streptomyces]
MTDPEYEAVYEFPEGKLYINILPARSGKEHWGDEWQRVTNHRLSVSSSGRDDEPLKIRGRRYQLGIAFARIPAQAEVWLRARSDEPELFQWDNSLRRWSMTNGDGKELGWNTAARERLAEIAAEAALRFENDHPEWRLTSERLEIENELREAEAAISIARESVVKAESRAVRLRVQIAMYPV